MNNITEIIAKTTESITKTDAISIKKQEIQADLRKTVNKKLDNLMLASFLSGTNKIDMSPSADNNVDIPKCIIKHTFNPDGTITIKYKNGVIESLDPKSNTGVITLPNQLDVKILEADENGMPTNIKAIYKGKEIEATTDDIIYNCIKLKNIDGKETDIHLNNSSWMRDKELSPDERKRMPKNSWANIEVYYTDPNNKAGNIFQKVNPYGRIELDGGDLIFGGRRIIDNTLQKDGRMYLENYTNLIKPQDKDDKLTFNTGKPYEVTLMKRYYKLVRKPDGTYKKELVKEVELSDKKTVSTNCYDARWIRKTTGQWEGNQRYDIDTEEQATIQPYITKQQIIDAVNQ